MGHHACPSRFRRVVTKHHLKRARGRLEAVSARAGPLQGFLASLHHASAALYDWYFGDRAELTGGMICSRMASLTVDARAAAMESYFTTFSRVLHKDTELAKSFVAAAFVSPSQGRLCRAFMFSEPGVVFATCFEKDKRQGTRLKRQCTSGVPPQYGSSRTLHLPSSNHFVYRVSLRCRAWFPRY